MGTTVQSSYGNWTFSTGSMGLNIFDVDAASFDSACTIDIEGLDAASTAIINVDGATARTTRCGMYIDGGGANGERTTLLVARGGVSTMEYYARPFEGELPLSPIVTPEPISALLLGSGLGGLAAARRRRRRRRDGDS